MSLPAGISPTRATQVQIPAIVFCVISPCIVAVRFFSRIKLGTKLGIDDWVCLLALACGVACSGVLIASCHFGYGIHGTDLVYANKVSALKFFVYSQYFYKSSINLTKASIILLYMRLFPAKPFRLICKGALIFVVAFGISTLVASIFQCTPITRSWDKKIPGTCINTIKFWYANAAISIAGDLLILALPMPLIYKLKLNIGVKVSLMFVFALGGFVMVTSILRMTALNTTAKTPDPTWDIGATTWTLIECHVAIICACLPMCRLPLTKIFPRLFPSFSTPHPHSTGAFVHAGTSKNDWTPSQTGSKLPRNQQTSVMAGPDDSEEFILNDLEASYAPPNKEGAGIHKTTHISVKYDERDNGSDTSGGRPMPMKYESKQRM